MVIQHPGGKVERLHGPAKEGEVMRGNPLRLVVVLRVSKTDPCGGGGGGARVTKVKLIEPQDALMSPCKVHAIPPFVDPSSSWPDSFVPEETRANPFPH